MDTVTHALVGLFFGIALAGILKFDSMKWPAIVGAFAGLAPDLDVVLTFFNSAIFLQYHRIVTHSLLFAIIGALVIALVCVRFKLRFSGFFKSDLAKYYTISFAALIAHLFLDIVTVPGVMLFYPFSEMMMSFAIMPIIDIVLIIILVSGLIVMEQLPRKKVKVAAMTLLMIAIFFAVKFSLYAYAENKVVNFEGFDGAFLIPHNFDPFEWRVVSEEEDSFLVADYGLFKGLNGKMEIVKQVNNLIEYSRDTELVKGMMVVSKFPFAVVDGNHVTWFDLRLSNDGHVGYTAKIVFDNEQKIIEERAGI